MWNQQNAGQRSGIVDHIDCDNNRAVHRRTRQSRSWSGQPFHWRLMCRSLWPHFALNKVCLVKNITAGSTYIVDTLRMFEIRLIRSVASDLNWDNLKQSH